MAAPAETQSEMKYEEVRSPDPFFPFPFRVSAGWWKRPRPAKGVRESLSRVRGNSPVRFFGERVRATSLAYATGQHLYPAVVDLYRRLGRPLPCRSAMPPR
jgi:hypothetical protein